MCYVKQVSDCVFDWNLLSLQVRQIAQIGDQATKIVEPPTDSQS